MANRRKNPFKELMQYMSYAIITDGILFVVYLIVAGQGIIWLKAITSILAILLSCLCLYVLYKLGELFSQRSLWMTVGAISVIVCTLVSLLLKFPG